MRPGLKGTISPYLCIDGTQIPLSSWIVLRYRRGMKNWLGPYPIGLLLFLWGCQTTAPSHTSDVDVTRTADGFVSAASVGLNAPSVLNERDFVYALAFNETSERIAYVHHVSTSMEVTLAGLQADDTGFRRPVNHHEFDAEDVLLVEDAGTTLVWVPSRQGILRRFDAQNADSPTEFIVGVPLTRIALSPSRRMLAVGTADGRVVLLDTHDLRFLGEERVHRDEIQGIRFQDESTLLTTGFDGELVRSAVIPGAAEQVRVLAQSNGADATVFLAHLGGARAIATTRDLRQPYNVISSAAVKRLGLTPDPTTPTLGVLGPVGELMRPVVTLGELQIRTLSLGASRAAVCDTCVPKGAELVLGRESLAFVVVGDDVATGELVFQLPATGALQAPPLGTALVAAEGAPTADAGNADADEAQAARHAHHIDGAVRLHVLDRLPLPGPATDLDLDHDRKWALVSYSHARAVRSVDLYEAEKKGRYPPPSPASGAILVQLDDFTTGKRFIGHRGFTTTAAISPDGRTVATGGWDNRLILFDAASGHTIEEHKLGWLARRVRFSPDGRLLAIASWTPANAVGDGKSAPSLQVFPMRFSSTAGP